MLLKLALALSILSSTSQAAWVVKADEPNMFGDTEMQAINVNKSGHGLVVKCNQSDSLTIAFIERDNSQKTSDAIPVTLYLQVDGAKPLTFDANLKAWNENYSGAVLEGHDGPPLQAAKLIASAKKSVSAGLKLGDTRIAETFDVVNQGDFVRALLRSCKIDNKQAS